MESLSGSWIGELNGTNKGRMFIRLAHEGDRIYGEGSFNEPSLGSYEYQVQGIVAGEERKGSGLLSWYHLSLYLSKGQGQT